VGVGITKFMVYGGFEIPKRSNGLGNQRVLVIKSPLEGRASSRTHQVFRASVEQRPRIVAREEQPQSLGKYAAVVHAKWKVFGSIQILRRAPGLPGSGVAALRPC